MKRFFFIFLIVLLGGSHTEAFCQKKFITEDLSFLIPQGLTSVENIKNEYPWAVYCGVNDSTSLTVMAIPMEIEMADGRVGVISEKYKNIKTIDTIYLPKYIYRCTDTLQEKWYQWTYRYVKKTFVKNDGWYTYTFASKTDNHVIFIIYNRRAPDNYVGIDAILSSFEYKTTVMTMIDHLINCADWRSVILFVLFLAVFIFVLLVDVGLGWKIAITVFSVFICLITSGTHWNYALAVVALFICCLIYGFYKEMV